MTDSLEFGNIKPMIEELCNLEEYSTIDLDTKYLSMIRSKFM
ncbi:hypothetical protein I3900191A7_24990 [Clostridium baratii]|nr:hypothetical protein [Clostridium baratii]MDY3207557.1 hypothetical protein [Clostridium baratii]